MNVYPFTDIVVLSVCADGGFNLVVLGTTGDVLKIGLTCT